MIPGSSPERDHERCTDSPDWQWCADGWDITASVHAELDATEARKWAGTDGFLCLAVEREAPGGRWSIASSEHQLPDAADLATFATPDDALDFVHPR